MLHSRLLNRLNRSQIILGLVLLVGMLNGLIYVFLVPPWQHYDEPTHFEFAWLIANRPGLPEVGDYDQGLLREVAASMIEHGFFQDMDLSTNLISQSKPVWIGISQITNKPLYYVLLSLPLSLVRGSDTTFQLYLGRSVSLLFFLLTLVSAFGIVRELTQPGHPLRWAVPLSLALLPGFVDIMTGLNDDVGAVAFFSLFLWAGVSLIKRGFKWLPFAGLIVSAAACFWMKNTVTVAAILLSIPILFIIFRGNNRRVAWGMLLFGSLILIPFIFRWDDAAYWYRRNAFDLGTRTYESGSPVGEHVFRFSLKPQGPIPTVVQVIPEPMVTSLRGMDVTLGAFIWASQPVIIETPILVKGEINQFEEVEVGVEPKFFAFTTKVNQNDRHLNVVLSPSIRDNDREITIYYDGILFVEGNHPLSSLPKYHDSRALEGLWGNESFVNILRNGSAETSWPSMNTWLDNLFTENFPGSPSLYLAFIVDPKPAFTYYRMAIERLSESFWAGFGWGHVPLRGAWSYRILKLLLLIGLIGASVVIYRRRKNLPVEILIFLGLSLLLVWGTAILRGTNTIIDGKYFIPVARYAYPAIIPTMLLLSAGWLGVTSELRRFTKIPDHIIALLFFAFFLALDFLGLFTIVNYYSGN